MNKVLQIKRMNAQVFFQLLMGILGLFILVSCERANPLQVDTIMYNGFIYTADSSFSTATAIAISGDTIAAIGKDKDLLKHFKSDKKMDLKGKVVYPGFIDAHCHFEAYGQDLQELDLKTAYSFDDMIEKTVAYAQKINPPIIVGRGWNEEIWESKTTPSKFKLDALFPETPVVLQRIDGHAVLCNQAALDLAGITENTVVAGGTITKMGFLLTGLLVDNAANLVTDKLPRLAKQQQIEALLASQKACLQAGLTCVSDAGIDLSTIELMDSLHRTGDLKIRIYAMANPVLNELEILFKSQQRWNPLLTVRAVKLYCDGSLGSRGALLKKPYCDNLNTHGLLQQEANYYFKMAKLCDANGFQVNTHCIGDSANKLILNTYASVLNGKNDKRWRIEHAQVVSPDDVGLFGRYSIIPSVQPTHATSDMYMAQERLCDADRLGAAYAYNTLMRQNNMIAFGTDFPVEDISPLGTFFSAVRRKGKDGETFQVEEAVSVQDAILAMTRWAAYANFMDHYTGSLEVGKKADLVVFDSDLGQMQNNRGARNLLTMINGVIVYNSGI